MERGLKSAAFPGSCDLTKVEVQRARKKASGVSASLRCASCAVEFPFRIILCKKYYVNVHVYLHLLLVKRVKTWKTEKHFAEMDQYKLANNQK